MGDEAPAGGCAPSCGFCDACGAREPEVWQIACERCGSVAGLCGACTEQVEVEAWGQAHASACGARVVISGPIRVTIAPAAAIPGGLITPAR